MLTRWKNSYSAASRHSTARAGLPSAPAPLAPLLLPPPLALVPLPLLLLPLLVVLVLVLPRLAVKVRAASEVTKASSASYRRLDHSTNWSLTLESNGGVDGGGGKKGLLASGERQEGGRRCQGWV